MNRLIKRGKRFVGCTASYAQWSWPNALYTPGGPSTRSANGACRLRPGRGIPSRL
jgi:hypothetical protein